MNASGFPGREDAEHQAGHHRDAQSKEEDRHVDARLLHAWDVGGRDANQQPDGPISQQDAYPAGRDAEHDALGEHVTYDLGARCPQGGAYGDLLSAFVAVAEASLKDRDAELSIGERRLLLSVGENLAEAQELELRGI